MIDINSNQTLLAKFLTEMNEISVIIPCYNHGQYIDEAVNSVLVCTEYNIEIIVVNDGSDDPFTLEKFAELEKKGIFVLHQTNIGLPAARNNGIKQSKSKYILPLDADNKITPELISKSIDILDNNPEIGVVYSDYYLFGEKAGIKKTGSFNIRKMIRANQIDACAVIRKDAWEQAGGYDESKLEGYEDWEFWLSVYKQNFKFHYLNIPLFYYRVRGNSLVSISRNKHDAIRANIHKKHWDLLSTEFLKMTTEERSIKHQIKSLTNNIKQRFLWSH